MQTYIIQTAVLKKNNTLKSMLLFYLTIFGQNNNKSGVKSHKMVGWVLLSEWKCMHISLFSQASGKTRSNRKK